MNARRLDFIWIVLLLATAFTWWLGESGAAGRTAVLTMLGVAGLKGVLVIRDFMDLRHVKVLWQAIVTGWLALVLALVMLAYWKGY